MSASPEVLETLGNYAIERSLAHGSMGHVYVARHTLTHARVALKVLRADLAADAQAEERFLREVRAAAHIGHDGIVKVHDAGRSSDGRLYLPMELLSGETLEERMTQQQGERLSTMEWLLRVLEPLAAAHAQSIVHRDLKPANVFIARNTDGSEHIKLLDFGLARDTREKSGTETGIALGTPYYMSPEQATRPKHVGPPSDVWSVGVMMYEVLSGSMPFEGETLHAVVIQSSTAAHVPLSLREPQLPSELCALVEDCLSKEPALRPANAAELLERLRPLLEDPELRRELEKQIAVSEPNSDEPAPLRLAAMPYADTAISLAPRLLESNNMRATLKRSTRGWWISALAVLALAAIGFVWALNRNDGKRTLEPRAPAPNVAMQPASKPVEPSTRESPAAALPSAPSKPPPASAAEPTRHNVTAPPAAVAPSEKPVAQPTAATPLNPFGTQPPTAAEPPVDKPAAPTAEPTAVVSPPAEAPVNNRDPSAEPPSATGEIPPSELPPPDPPEPDPSAP